jgi:cell wall-associated NlpC family hydrolase
LTKKPSGRRRADVQINLLESFELRSRSSVRQSQLKRQARAQRKLQKQEAKLARKFSGRGSVSQVTSASAITGLKKIPLRKNSTLRSAIVMSVTAGFIATAALPAYAFSPAVTAMSGLTGTVDVTDAQTITILRQSAIDFERGSYGLMSANDLERMNNRNNYLGYKGKTAFDFAAHPNYLELKPDDIMKVAAKYVGTPYVLGGENPNGLDCSGYTRLVFSEFGLLLPHSVNAQSHDPHLRRIPRSQAEPGDLVILNDLSHEGIYAGPGMFFHAPFSGDKVKLAPIFTDSYFIARVVK